MADLKQQLAPGWTPVNIGIGVVLFMVSWPLAVIMIAYIVWGEKAGLDLGRPATFGVFGKRLAAAWKAAMASFSNRN